MGQVEASNMSLFTLKLAKEHKKIHSKAREGFTKLYEVLVP